MLVQAKGLGSLWCDIRGQLLLMALYASTMYLVVRMQWPEAEHWLLFSYLVLGFSGLLLVLQPVPGWWQGAKHTLDPFHHLKRWTFDSCLFTLKFLR